MSMPKLTMENWIAGIRFGVIATLCHFVMRYFGFSTSTWSFSEMVVYFIFMTVGWAFASRYVYRRIGRSDRQ